MEAPVCLLLKSNLVLSCSGAPDRLPIDEASISCNVFTADRKLRSCDV